MGGNALKNVQTMRLPKDKYNIVKKTIYDKISQYFPIYYLYELPEKTDFGDLDILYDLNLNSIYQLIEQLFNPVEMVHNGNVISFSYLIEENQYFQIDMIKVSNIECALFFFSYGDLGSILGRIIKYYDLTFGFDGMWLIPHKSTIQEHKYWKEKCIENKDVIKELGEVQKIFLTNKPEEICAFFGYDYEKWKSGFTTHQEIFDFITSSHYFIKFPFHKENSNYAMRKRIVKRKFYNEFLNYLENDDTLCDEDLHSCTLRNLQPLAISYFEKEYEFEKNIDLYFLHQKRKNKFNGKMIIDLINTTNPKEVGNIILLFRDYIADKNNCTFEDWLDQVEQKDVIEELHLFISDFTPYFFL